MINDRVGALNTSAVAQLVEQLLKSYPAKVLVEYEKLLGLQSGLMSCEQAADGKKLIEFARLIAVGGLADGDFYGAGSDRLYWDLRLSPKGYVMLLAAFTEQNFDIEKLSRVVTENL